MTPILLPACPSSCYMKPILLPFCRFYCYMKQILLPSCPSACYMNPILLQSAFNPVASSRFCYHFAIPSAIRARFCCYLCLAMKRILLPFCCLRRAFIPKLRTEAGRVPLCGLNTASPLRASAVLRAQSRKSAVCQSRICFREAKYAATAHSAGPALVHCFSEPPLSSFSFDFAGILMYFAPGSRF